MGSWTHKPEKRQAQKERRQRGERGLLRELVDCWRRRGINRRPYTNEAGDTVWPDSATPGLKP